MKKRSSPYVVTVFIAITLALPLFAQQLAANENKEAWFPDVQPGSGLQYVNDVNGKVLRSFQNSFGQKQDLVWTKSGNDFIAFFKEADKVVQVYFTAKGTIQYTVLHYKEDQLRKDVRHTVRSSFYDDTITHVAEVRKDDTVCFFITVMDKTSIRTIRVTDGEMEVIETVRRQSVLQ